jgi:Domain of unknown function (DUF4286)
MSTFIYIAMIDIPADIETDFNRIYDEKHIPDLLKVPGVKSAVRYRLRSTDTDEIPRYLAVYEVDDPKVPNGPAWRAAADEPEWMAKIRPRMLKRRHGLFEKMD